jgi:hypothetical protein
VRFVGGEALQHVDMNATNECRVGDAATDTDTTIKRAAAKATKHMINNTYIILYII